MSGLQRPTPSPSYSPLSQHSHIDDDGHILGKEKETALSPHGQGKRHILPLSQLAIILVLLLLAATAGFFLARCFPQTRLGAPSLPHTVPQGSSFSPALHLPSADSSILVITGLSKETFRYNQSFAAAPPEQGGPEPIWDSLIPSECIHLLKWSQLDR